MNFLLEPLGFSEIVNLWEIYGQKVIDTVFYCTRTFAYYIYREKQITLVIWPGGILAIWPGGIAPEGFRRINSVLPRDHGPRGIVGQGGGHGTSFLRLFV